MKLRAPTPLDKMGNGSIIDVPSKVEDFTSNASRLLDAMKKVNMGNHASYLGKLQGFDLIYDGILLSFGRPDMNREDIEKLREKFVGKFFSNGPSAMFSVGGEYSEINLKRNGNPSKLWMLSIEITCFSNNSPTRTLQHLSQLTEELQKI